MATSSTETRVVFASGFEGLFSKDFRKRLTPALIAELKALGVNIEKPFNPAYTVETWASVINACSRHIYPELSLPDASWKLGRDTVDGFAHTMIGKALFTMMKLIGPARSLERSMRSYASTNNYTKVTLQRTGPTSYDFGLNEKHTLPQYDMGVVEWLLQMCGAKNVSVTLTTHDAEGFMAQLTWE
ncbi:MAG: DUF2378 family protein [Archangium sp.]|nr:DUF2378 family protein [Archangium sp.]